MAVKFTESTGLLIKEKPLSASAVDTLGINESVTLIIREMPLQLPVTSEFAIGDFASVHISNLVPSVSDSVTFSEAVEAWRMEPPLQPSTTDSLKISELVTLLHRGFSVLSRTAITEVVLLRISQLHLGVTDEIKILEDIVAGMEGGVYELDESVDTLSIIETIGMRIAQLRIPQAQTIGFVEDTNVSVSTIVTLAVDAFDTLTITEDADLGGGKFKSVHNFPSGVGVTYQTVNSNNEILQSYTASGVTERVVNATAGKSIYMAYVPSIKNDMEGVISWQTDEAMPKTASSQFDERLTELDTGDLADLIAGDIMTLLKNIKSLVTFDLLNHN